MGFNFSGFEEHRRGRVRGSRPAVAGIGKRSRRLRDWRPFGGCDLHWVGGFGSGAAFCKGCQALHVAAFFSGVQNCGAALAVESVCFDQFRLKLAKNGHDVEPVDRPSRFVGSHDAAQVFSFWRDWPTLGRYEVEYQAAEHTERGSW